MADLPTPAWALGYAARIQESVNDAHKLANEMEEWLRRLDKVSEHLTALVE